VIPAAKAGAGHLLAQPSRARLRGNASRVPRFRQPFGYGSSGRARRADGPSRRASRTAQNREDSRRCGVVRDRGASQTCRLERAAGRRIISATEKQYCPSSSAVARHLNALLPPVIGHFPTSNAKRRFADCSLLTYIAERRPRTQSKRRRVAHTSARAVARALVPTLACSPVLVQILFDDIVLPGPVLIRQHVTRIPCP
jgi:hypothetical protein